MSLAMTRAEREGFLAALHVGVLAVAEEGRGPLLAPIWYGYEPGGEVRIVTGRDARPLAHRYLGPELGDRYLETSAGEEAAVLVRMRPERWLTVDYRKQYGGG